MPMDTRDGVLWVCKNSRKKSKNNPEKESRKTMIFCLLIRSAMAPPNGAMNICGKNVKAMIKEKMAAEPVISRINRESAKRCRLLPNNEINYPTTIMVKFLFKSFVFIYPP